jgi:hypothetical protein
MEGAADVHAQNRAGGRMRAGRSRLGVEFTVNDLAHQILGEIQQFRVGIGFFRDGGHG